MRGRILIVDDEPLKRIALQVELSEQGYEVREAETAQAALRLLDETPADVMVADAQLPDIGGLDLLTRVKQAHPRVAVILMSASANVEAVILAIQRGAWDYLVKPFTTPDLLVRLERLFAARPPAETEGPDEAGQVETWGRLIAASLGMKRLFETVRKLAPSGIDILLSGEAGTGKTALAETIHIYSPRRNRPFVRFDCAAPATPEASWEALFGREKGAGADTPRPKAGLLEQADGGTLLLANLQALSLDAQAALLRFLETREFQRRDGDRPISLDVRFIGATTRDLAALVREGRFREDLYYRLQGCLLLVPPLRERLADITVLARHFLAKHAAMIDRRTMVLSASALEELLRQRWPGNVRELEQALERGVAFCDEAEIRWEHVLPPDGAPWRGVWSPGGAPDSSSADGLETKRLGLNEAVAELERRMILLALRQCDGNQARAAQRLGIPRTTLRDKMMKYGLPLDGAPLEK